MKAPRVPDLRRRDILKAAGAIIALHPLLLEKVSAAADAGKIKIGVIGSGNVGSALGRVWANAGHQVMFASRNLEHDKQLAATIGANARAGTPAEAVDPNSAPPPALTERPTETPIPAEAPALAEPPSDTPMPADAPAETPAETLTPKPPDMPMPPPIEALAANPAAAFN